MSEQTATYYQPANNERLLDTRYTGRGTAPNSLQGRNGLLVDLDDLDPTLNTVPDGAVAASWTLSSFMILQVALGLALVVASIVRGYRMGSSASIQLGIIATAPGVCIIQFVALLIIAMLSVTNMA